MEEELFETLRKKNYEARNYIDKEISRIEFSDHEVLPEKERILKRLRKSKSYLIVADKKITQPSQSAKVVSDDSIKAFVSWTSRATDILKIHVVELCFNEYDELL